MTDTSATGERPKVYVTYEQVLAAQVAIKAAKILERPVPASIRRIAAAKPERASSTG